MERRTSRVSEAQWSILLEFLERHPNMAKARGYNNSARGRAESARLWQEVADQLNAEGLGSYKTPKDWSIYVSNYKSKIKKIVAGINDDIEGTGGGPPRDSFFSDLENRFLALLGPGFGQTAPRVRVHPFPEADLQQPSMAAMSGAHDVAIEIDIQDEDHEHVQTDGPADVAPADVPPSVPLFTTADETEVPQSLQLPPPSSAAVPPLPRRSRQSRYRSRPLAPLDEARRILSQVEMQRAAADAATARALDLIGQNLGRVADAIQDFSLTRPL